MCYGAVIPGTELADNCRERRQVGGESEVGLAAKTRRIGNGSGAIQVLLSVRIPKYSP